MRIDRDRIREHARERLGDLPGGADPRARLDSFKRFLKLETDRLRMRHRFGLGGLEIASARSYQVDQVVDNACRLALEAAPDEEREAAGRCAVVALGGYGRAELSPFSDVDLLFLHGGHPGDEVRGFVERVLQLLWDVGLTVGHSFRSARECVSEARGDLHSRTALAEARLIAGDERLFAELDAVLDGGLRFRRDHRAGDAFLESLRADVAERYARFGGAVCVQEPNVKEGVGGLRDLHVLLWIAHARHGSRGLAELHTGGLLSERDYRLARRAYDFLLRVRAEVHFVTARKTDLLSLDLQPDVARSLGYEATRGLLASELLMRDYYRRATELHRVAAGVLRRPTREVSRPLLGSLTRRRPARDFEVRGGELHVKSPVLLGSGRGLLAAFAASQAEGVPLSDTLAAAIRERIHLVGPSLRSSSEAAEAFVDVLRWRGRVAGTLRAMHDTGFLGRFLPEFGRIGFLVQHDLFHRYTVDEHTLRAIEALDEVASGGDPALRPFGRIFDEIEDAAPLYLGMLLHDIGKGRGGAHVERGARMVPRVSARLRLPEPAAADVLFLVEEHLEMSRVSQHRDLSEPALIASFAARIGSLHRLNLLHLLTYADHRGVAPGIWNEWKGALLWELYQRTRERLAGHAAEGERDARARAVATLRREFPEADIEHHFALLPERYLRRTDAARMARHFRLVQGKGEATAAFEWRDLEGGHGTELTLVTSDRRGLLAAAAGTLTANGVNILAVDLFNRRDGVVIDTFKLSEVSSHRPVKAERRVRVEGELVSALGGAHDVGAAVARWLERNPRRPQRALGRAARGPAVRFDQESSATATVIEVSAQDRPGLAWTIADTLAQLDLNIAFAKIATAKALALDVFYVTDAGGRKLAPEVLAAVEEALVAALGGRPETGRNEEEE
jgi:[protein-PII] uridylyltransferase